MRRRKASARREQLAAAGERVIADRGLEGLTHRAVAEEAGIPIGSTTYYFADRGDLIDAVLHRAVDGYAEYTEKFVLEHADDTADQLVGYLVDVVMNCVGSESGQSIVEFELSLTAHRRPELRGPVRRFLELDIAALASRFTDPLTAKAVSLAMTGLIFHGLSSETALERDDIAAIIRRMIAARAASG